MFDQPDAKDNLESPARATVTTAMVAIAGKLVDSDGHPLDEATHAHFFRPASRTLFDHPVCGAALRRLAETFPEVLDAVADVDRSQIWDCMEASPAQRLRAADADSNSLARFRRVD